MKYEIYRIGDNNYASMYHTVLARYVTVEGGAYILYDNDSSQPTAIYPVRSYVVKKA